MLLVDHEIRSLCTSPLLLERNGGPLLDPFSEQVSGGGVISYGLTSAGYDLRLAPEVLVFKNSYAEVVDPRRFGDSSYQARVFERLSLENGCLEVWDDGTVPVLIPPNSYVLGRSLEYIRMPGNLKARCVGKSTIARCGIVVNCTPVEPRWHGYLTIEIANVCPCPVRIFANQGVAQLEFEFLTGEPEADYTKRGGKYNGQVGVTPARVL